MSFKEFRLDTRIEQVLESEGFDTPTPIQKEAIPVLLKGEDVLGLAQTGTGKTAAFVLPILQKLSVAKSREVRALILAPTRELAQQIHEVVVTFGKPLGLKSITAFGGASLVRQCQALRKGVDIVVGCPGRVYDLMDRGDLYLDELEMLVLDEADQMFDMGFIPTIRRIVQMLPRNRQTMLFSATMPSSIRSLAENILRHPKRIEVAYNAPVATVTHALYPVVQHLKSALLMKLLEKIDTESVLIFVRTKHRAKRLSHQLSSRNLKVTSLQGNLSQGQRSRAMSGFRDGSFQIMVATDIAARGIDVSSVSHVINYDIPDTVEAYTHRIGRTGRAARNGDAFTFISPGDEQMVRSIEKTLKTKIERRTIDNFDYNGAPQEYLQASNGSKDDDDRPRRARPARRSRSSHPRRSSGGSRRRDSRARGR
ncbi:MAG: DEAD/DEAH box helicase [Bdellovibrionales bacterium]|nr:DEAD/DEAH box helicase [Bdellovibrionales bacterium]